MENTNNYNTFCDILYLLEELEFYKEKDDRFNFDLKKIKDLRTNYNLKLMLTQKLSEFVPHGYDSILKKHRHIKVDYTLGVDICLTKKDFFEDEWYDLKEYLIKFNTNPMYLTYDESIAIVKTVNDFIYYYSGWEKKVCDMLDEVKEAKNNFVKLKHPKHLI